MRNLFLLVLAAHAFVAAAAPKIKQKTNNGIWRLANTWDLNRIPANTDTVVIPSGNVVIIDDHQNLGNSKLIVMVYGTLQFTGVGKLTLDANSAVFVQSGGIVDGSGSSAQKLKIGSQQLSGTELQVAAAGNALLLTATSNGYENVPPGSGFGTFMVLPVTFTGFTIAAADKGVRVNWETVNELHHSHFEIERSYDLSRWTKLAIIPANAGSLGGRYSYKDVEVGNGNVHYRIKQVDADGRFVYSPYRSLVLGEKPVFKAWSGNSELGIRFAAPVEESLKISLLDMSGKLVQQETLQRAAGQLMMDKKGRKGYFLLIITGSKGLYLAQKLLL